MRGHDEGEGALGAGSWEIVHLTVEANDFLPKCRGYLSQSPAPLYGALTASHSLSEPPYRPPTTIPLLPHGKSLVPLYGALRGSHGVVKVSRPFSPSSSVLMKEVVLVSFGLINAV